MNYNFSEFEQLCNENNISVRTGVMSTKVRGFAIYYGGKYLVYVNCNMVFSQQQKSTVHELIHIFEKHFTCNIQDATKCEKEVQNIIFQLNLYDLERGSNYVTG